MCIMDGIKTQQPNNSAIPGNSTIIIPGTIFKKKKRRSKYYSFFKSFKEEYSLIFYIH